jgi:hypothetical protein
VSSVIEPMIIKILEGFGSLVTRRSRNVRKESPKDSILLGQAEDLYRPKRIEDIYRRNGEKSKHTFILGATGSGKTKLIEHLIRQEILNENGWCLIDPHGDLSENILQFIGSRLTMGDPDQLTKYISERLLVIEPANEESAVGLNPIEAVGVGPYALVSELIGILKRQWSDAYWGPRMEELLFHLLMALCLDRWTLLEARPLLEDTPFREDLVSRLPHGETKAYWSSFGSLSAAMQKTYSQPILTRLSLFLSSPPVRLMVGQKRSSFNFRNSMDQGKCIIINLSKGRLKDSYKLLGGFFIAKIQLAALSRIDIPEAKRTPFTLYIDEFQNFVGHDLDTTLSEARKFQLSIVIANQYLAQLEKPLRESILGNVATQIYFRLSHQDAGILSSELNPREKPMIQRRLIDLKTGEAYLKIKGERPRLMKTIHVPSSKCTKDDVDTVKRLSFSAHGRPRKEVQNEIVKRTKSILVNGEAQNRAPAKDPEAGRFAPSGEFEETHDW